MENSPLQIYKKAYDLHYREKKLLEASTLYQEIMQKFPDTDVSVYSSLQLSKIRSNSVSPGMINRKASSGWIVWFLIIVNLVLTAGIITGLVLNIAANYGGKWDMVQAMRKIAVQVEQGELSAEDINEELVEKHLSLNDLPNPDLFIRTGGEQRISNFLIWQLAYSELYFTRILWPDFDREEYAKAITSFSSRQRRFGKTGAQVLEQEQRDHA